MDLHVDRQGLTSYKIHCNGIDWYLIEQKTYAHALESDYVVLILTLNTIFYTTNNSHFTPHTYVHVCTIMYVHVYLTRNVMVTLLFIYLFIYTTFL